MSEVSVNLAIGRTVTVEVDRGLEPPAFFVLSMRKCGSTMLNQICRALAVANHRRYVDVVHHFFYNNILELQYRDDPAMLSLLYPGNTYGGFRLMPRIFFESELFLASPKVLLVRDPRDALASEYFSSAYSHPIPESGDEGDDVTTQLVDLRSKATSSTIDEWVLARAAAMNRHLVEYEALLGDTSTLVLKYEDCVFDKPMLMSSVANHFGWHIDDQLVRLILEWADVRPEKEDPKEFIRQVTPGDHLAKLSPETIAEVSRTLAPAMTLFRYTLSI